MRAVRDEVGSYPCPGSGSRARFRERYQLYGLGYRLLGDHGEAEDVVRRPSSSWTVSRPAARRGDRGLGPGVCLNTTYNRLRGQRRTTARLSGG